MHAHAPRPPTLVVAVALGTVYLVWGSTYLAIAFVVDTLPPLLAAGTRFVVAGSVLLAFLRARDRWRRRGGTPGRARLGRPSLVHWRSALIVGGLLLLGGNGLVSVAERTVPSGIAAVIIATVPIWMSVIEALVTRRAPSLLAGGGLLVGLIGVGILLLPTSGLGALDPIGIGILVIAAVSWAVGSVYARYGRLPGEALQWTGMQQLAGGAAVLVAAVLVGEPWRLDPGSVSAASILGLAYLVVFGSLVGFTAYLWLLSNAPISTVTTYAYVNPVVAVALGFVVRSEPLSLRTLLAAALILGAVVAMVSGRPRQAEETGPVPEAGALDPDLESEEITA